MNNATNDKSTDLNGLTAQERALIEAFRAMTPAQQEKLLKIAREKKLDQGRQGFYAGRG